MNDQNKVDKNPENSYCNDGVKYPSIIKLTYLEYLKQQYTQDLEKTLTEENIPDPKIQKDLFKYLKNLKGEKGNENELHNSDYIIMKIEPDEGKSRKKGNNVFKEYLLQKQELFMLKQKEKEDEEIDGFIWIQDPPENHTGFRSKIRKYFLQHPELDKAKRREGEGDMIDDFVLVNPANGYNVKMENKLRQGFIDLTAGSLAGLLQVYISQPLDTIKVKQQTFPKLYKNMFKCFTQTYRKDGLIRGLYAGSIPAAIASVAENSILFAAYGGCQEAVANVMEIDKVSEMSSLGNACAGFLAAFFSSFTLCPAELIKCKLQAVREMKQYVSKDSKVVPLTALKLTTDIFLNEGLLGFYRGLTSTLVREMPGSFFFFGSYEATRTYFTEPGQTKDDIGPLRTMCSGAVGGIILWTTTFPADVIKSRIQINNLKGSMLSVGSEILHKEGLFAFYNGLLPTILRTIPATATLFLVYEYTKKVLSNKL